MNILFGEVTGDYLDSCLEDGDEMFEYDGRYYDFTIKMEPTHFTIRDTVGRILPIGVEEFEEFYQAVKLAKNYARSLAKLNRVAALVEDDEVLVVCD